MRGNVIVNKNYVAKCSGCHTPLTLYEYKGLEGSIYGPPHPCPEMDQILFHDDAEAPLFYDLREIGHVAMPNLA